LNHEGHEWHEIEKRIVCCSFVLFVIFVVNHAFILSELGLRLSVVARSKTKRPRSKAG